MDTPDPTLPVNLYYDQVLNRRRADLLDDLLAPGFVSHRAGRTFSSDQYRAAVALTLAQFAGLKVTVEAQLAQGALVATRWRAEGTLGGRPLTVTAMHFHRVDDGRLAEHWEELDPTVLGSPIQSSAR